MGDKLEGRPDSEPDIQKDVHRHYNNEPKLTRHFLSPLKRKVNENFTLLVIF